MKPISVVIPTWNAAGAVARSLPSVLQQEGVELEVLVVDNGVVNDETERVVRGLNDSRVRYLRFPEQLGYAGAVNAGVREARNPWIAVCNNDNMPERTWLRRLAEVMSQATWPESGRKIAVVGARVDRDTWSDDRMGGMNIFGRIVRTPHPRGESVQPVFMPDGSSFLFNRDLLGEPYESEYFIYHEDAALGWRARLNGLEVLLNPKSVARTFDEGSTRRIPYRTAFYTERNRWLNRLVFPSWWTRAILMDWWGLDWLAGIIGGQNRRARVHAWWWVTSHPLFVWRLRKKIQAQRQVPDSIVLSHIYSDWFSGKPSGWRGRANRFLHGYFSFFGLKFKT